MKPVAPVSAIKGPLMVVLPRPRNGMAGPPPVIEIETVQGPTPQSKQMQAYPRADRAQSNGQATAKGRPGLFWPQIHATRWVGRAPFQR
ncbi:hypothetical protein GCM10007884_16530 [Methylobacterium brachythecii]|uniref:Uncharacterized protein n=1 Tax=Methylobacterium brachythecii TaxID=1176177 RepID=A0ABQ6D288_9HYPH|nr:hypothetical protein GCM10007884_16530 [Methylobacterium brachythecii]